MRGLRRSRRNAARTLRSTQAIARRRPCELCSTCAASRKSFYSRAGLFGRREFKAVQDVSFKLARGRTVGLVGESGCGKTTRGPRADAAGTKPRAARRCSRAATCSPCRRREFMPYKRRIQIVFQNPYASLNPRFTVGQILMEPLAIHGIGADDGAERREIRACRCWNAQVLGLPESGPARLPARSSPAASASASPSARCLTMHPGRADLRRRPVSALDVSVQAQVLNLLSDLQEEYGMSYLFISHDLAVVRQMADEVLVMQAGRIVESAQAEELYRNPHDIPTRSGRICWQRY